MWYNSDVRINQYNGGRWRIDETYFDNLDTQEKYRFLGFLYSDGNNYPEEYKITINLSSSRAKLLNFYRNELKFEKPVKYYDVNGHSSCRLVFKNKHLSKRLEELGVVKNKSLKVKYPEFISEPWQHQQFIGGIWDGDGILSFRPEDSRRRYVSIGFIGNNELVDPIHDHLVNTLKINKMSAGYYNKKVLTYRTSAKESFKKIFKYMIDGPIVDPVKYEKGMLAMEMINGK